MTYLMMHYGSTKAWKRYPIKHSLLFTRMDGYMQMWDYTWERDDFTYTHGIYLEVLLHECLALLNMEMGYDTSLDMEKGYDTSLTAFEVLWSIIIYVAWVPLLGLGKGVSGSLGAGTKCSKTVRGFRGYSGAFRVLQNLKIDAPRVSFRRVLVVGSFLKLPTMSTVTNENYTNDANLVL